MITECHTYYSFPNKHDYIGDGVKCKEHCYFYCADSAEFPPCDSVAFTH